MFRWLSRFFGNSRTDPPERQDHDAAFARELDTLISKMKDSADPQSRGYAAQLIGARRRKAAKAIPDRRSAKRPARPRAHGCRLNAIISLGELGPTAKTAIPLLKSIASNPNETEEIRFRAGVNAKILEQE